MSADSTPRRITIDELRRRGFHVPEPNGRGFGLPLSGPLPDKPPAPEALPDDTAED